MEITWGLDRSIDTPGFMYNITPSIIWVISACYDMPTKLETPSSLSYHQDCITGFESIPRHCRNYRREKFQAFKPQTRRRALWIEEYGALIGIQTCNEKTSCIDSLVCFAVWLILFSACSVNRRTTIRKYSQSACRDGQLVFVLTLSHSAGTFNRIPEIPIHSSRNPSTSDDLENATWNKNP